MIVIKNKLDQRITIELKNKLVQLLSGETADINEKDLKSPHLKSFIGRGAVVVVPPAGSGKGKKKKSGKSPKKK